MIPAQYIVGSTGTSDPAVEIMVLEHGQGKYSALMTAIAFPAGTFFPTAEYAVVRAIAAINAVMTPKKIQTLRTQPVEEFVSNERLAKLVEEIC